MWRKQQKSVSVNVIVETRVERKKKGLSSSVCLNLSSHVVDRPFAGKSSIPSPDSPQSLDGCYFSPTLVTDWFWGVVSEAVEELRRSPQRGIPTPERLERNGPLATIVLQVHDCGGRHRLFFKAPSWVPFAHPPPLSLSAGRVQPGAVRPAACGVVSGLARCGPRLADGQPLLGW